MGDVKYTKQQQQVISQRDANVLVSAAAGSGKTQVLTERILSLITDEEKGVDIDHLLVLTFTKAAASEMRERISRKISQALAKDPDNERLWRQSVLVQYAQITTIDSFCLFVIRNNFADINLDPGFRIMDQYEGKLVRQDVLTELLENEFEEARPEFIHLVECYGSMGSERKIEEELLDMYEFVMSSPNPEKWMDEAMDIYAVKSSDDIDNLELMKKTAHYRESLVEILWECALEAVDLCKDPCVKDSFRNPINSIYEIAKVFHECSDYRSRSDILASIVPASFPGGRTPAGALGEIVNRLRYLNNNRFKFILGELKKYYGVSVEQVASDGEYCQMAGLEFLGLLKKLINAFTQKKRELGVIDFNDMEHLALKILVKDVKTVDGHTVIEKTDTAKEYTEFFSTVMVDEYQDSNYVQEYILKSITREDNYFMVGDVKQSIYRFRQARPQIFVDKYLEYSSDREEDGNSKDVVIDLNKNFRSRSEVLDFSNLIFENIMNAGTAMVDYDAAAKLYYGLDAVYKDRDDCKAEVLILDKSSADDKNLGRETHSGEAYMVAQKIKELKRNRFQVYDSREDRMRDVEYRDIVILMRSPSGIDQTFMKVFEEQDIPVYTDIKSGYFDTFEIKNIINLLRILDNPKQDIPFYGTLTSYFGGFTPEDAALIKVSDKERACKLCQEGVLTKELPSISFYDAFMSCEDSAITDKKQKFLDFLSEYRMQVTYMPIRQLVEKIITETGYLEYMSAFPDGERRRANIIAFLERASDFEKTSYHGLFHFIRYIDQLKARAVELGEAGTCGENDNVVRIMSVHASKGLEYPVCFLCGTGKGINKKDSSGIVLTDSDYGLGIDYINPVTREKRKTLQKRLMAECIEMENQAEEIRILYVALTRAREKLFITGSADKKEGFVEKLPEPGKLSDVDIIGAGSHLMIICQALKNMNVIDDYVSYKAYGDILKEQISADAGSISLGGILSEGAYEVDEDIVSKINEKINFVYPKENLKGLYVKTTVSEIKKAKAQEANEDAYSVYEQGEKQPIIPYFAIPDETYDDETYDNETYDNETFETFDKGAKKAEDGRNNIGALFGTAMHRMMELIDYKEMQEALSEAPEAAKSEAAIKDRLLKTKEKHIGTGRLSIEYADLLNIGKCCRFFRTDVAKEMCKAADNNLLYKERSFFLGVNANVVDPKFPEQETMLVQGIIDVYYEDEGQIVLLDYKTDKVKDGDELIRRYKPQLDIYAEAIERITGKKVKRKVMYSFSLEQVVEVV